MATEVTMPKLGLTMEEGTVLSWGKKAGESVEKGETLLVIQTDKVEYEVEAPASGIVLKTLAGEGDVIPTGQVIALIGKAGEKVEETAPAPAPPKAGAAAPQPAGAAQQPAAATPQPASGGDGRVFISPLARKLAREMGVDYAKVQGSGPKGRIVKDDILRAAKAAPPPMARPVPPPAVMEIILETIPVRGMRKVIAGRMAASWSSAP
ncbi:MAG: E3 binding domain-containing protein, partial [Candidatus Tectomicrobia bacterium]|nr:E3 binding domain-containing protein [Candidatus Tectomicrobia bacterium]